MHSDDARMAYEQLCDTYRAIDDFRGKLLGFLPLATGVGIFVVVKDGSNLLERFAMPVGVVGMVITLGLYLFEIHGIAKCHELIAKGRRFELQRDLQGQFWRHRIGKLWTFSEYVFDIPLAAGLIYGAVMVSWLLLLLTGGKDTLAATHWVLALGVLIVLAAIPFEYSRRLTKRLEQQCDAQKTESEHGLAVRLTAFGPRVEVVLCQECSEALASVSRK